MKKFTSTEAIVTWREKEFRCAHEVSVDDLLEVLADWERGAVEPAVVLLFAEGLRETSGGWPSYRRTESRSVLVAVLQLLELVFINPVLLEDVPQLRSCLEMSRHDPVAAHKAMDRYWDQIDWDARARLTGPCYPPSTSS